MVVVMILVSACPGELDSQWVRTTGGVPLGHRLLILPNVSFLIRSDIK